MALFYSGDPKMLISSGHPNSIFDAFCRICDNFCKGNVHRRDAKGAEFYLFFVFHLKAQTSSCGVLIILVIRSLIMLD